MHSFADEGIAIWFFTSVHGASVRDHERMESRHVSVWIEAAPEAVYEFAADPHEWPRWAAGLAPLEDTPFNRAKSDLKFLEYSALGLPTVASRVTPYLGIDAHGGVLADNSDALRFYERLGYRPTWLYLSRFSGRPAS